MTYVCSDWCLAAQLNLLQRFKMEIKMLTLIAHLLLFLYVHVFDCSIVTFLQLSMVLMGWLELHKCLTCLIIRMSDWTVSVSLFLCLTDRSQPDRCSCGEPSPRSSQDGRYLWLRSTRKLPQHWHRGQAWIHLIEIVKQTRSCVFISRFCSLSVCCVFLFMALFRPSWPSVQETSYRCLETWTKTVSST